MKDRILQLVSEKFNVSQTDLLSLKKKGIISDARQALFLSTYMAVTRNKSQISDWFNRKSPTSAGKIISTAEDYYDTDPPFRKKVDWVVSQV